MNEISEELISRQELNILESKGYQLEKSPFNKGSFSSVFKAKFQDITVAIKVIDCQKVSNDYKNRFLPRELYALNKLKHKFLITIYEILTINSRVFLAMEYMNGGDLFELIRASKLIEESFAKILFRQISEALNYIHSEGLAHRDLKCENIILNKTHNVAKLTDFGFARTCYDGATGRRLLTKTQCGSIAFVGPELIKDPKFDAIIHDCWSIGVVLYCMTVGKQPFSIRIGIKELLAKQLKKEYELNDLKISNELKDLISKLLEPNVKTRINMIKVLEHKWIKDIKV